MPSEVVTLDPTSEDAANVQVLLEDRANGIKLVSHEYPDPGVDYMGVTSADTEGSVYVQNQLKDREITAVVRCFDVAAGDGKMRDRVSDLQAKVAKLNRDKGTYKRTLTDATVIVFDVKSVTIQVPSNWQFLHKNDIEVTMTFLCAPLGRGAEQTLADHPETTLPVCIGVDTGVLGDYPALGRLVVDNDASADQWHVIWGVQSRYYDSANTANLFYEAEALVRQGGGTVAAVASASGGTVVRNTDLPTTYMSVLSTQLGPGTAGTAYMRHVGDYEVWGRMFVPATNAGTVSVAFEWAEGDFRRYTRNDPVDLDPVYEGQWVRRSLGLINLSPAVTGTKRWEGRVIAKSTAASDDLDIDYLFFVPVTEGSGAAEAVMQVETPTTISARDEFNQSAGALTGKTAAIGGVWAGAGDTDDFAVSGGGGLTRTATSDTVNTGRYAVSGVTGFALQAVQADVMWTSALTEPDTSGTSQGVLARYTDANNYLLVFLGKLGFWVIKKVAGTRTTLYQSPQFDHAISTWYTIRIAVDAAGRWFAWYWPEGAAPSAPIASGRDSDLATGGILASGKPGIYDEADLGNTRSYDNFVAWTPASASDAAVFASQSMEVRHNTALREDAGGSVWAKPSRYDGDYLRVPAAGVEARSVRTLVAAHRNAPDTMPDTAIDDISYRLYVTPRYVHVPPGA